MVVIVYIRVLMGWIQDLCQVCKLLKVGEKYRKLRWLSRAVGVNRHLLGHFDQRLLVSGQNGCWLGPPLRRYPAAAGQA